MLEQVLAIRKRAFGESPRPSPAPSPTSATVNSISGNPAAAEPLYREAYAMMAKFLGPDNPDVSEVLLGQGRNFHRLGKLPEAEATSAVPSRSASPPSAKTAARSPACAFDRQGPDRHQRPGAIPKPTNSSSSPTRAVARAGESPTPQPSRPPGPRRSVQGVGQAGEGEGAGGGADRRRPRRGPSQSSRAKRGIPSPAGLEPSYRLRDPSSLRSSGRRAWKCTSRLSGRHSSASLRIILEPPFRRLPSHSEGSRIGRPTSEDGDTNGLFELTRSRRHPEHPHAARRYRDGSMGPAFLLSVRGA